MISISSVRTFTRSLCVWHSSDSLQSRFLFVNKFWIHYGTTNKCTCQIFNKMPLFRLRKSFSDTNQTRISSISVPKMPTHNGYFIGRGKNQIYSNEILMILFNISFSRFEWHKRTQLMRIRFNIQRPLFNIQCTILSKMEWIKCVWSYYGKITENIVFPSAKRRVKIFNQIWNIFPVDLSSIIICSFISFLCTKFIYYYVWYKFKQT